MDRLPLRTWAELRENDRQRQRQRDLGHYGPFTGKTIMGLLILGLTISVVGICAAALRELSVTPAGQEEHRDNVYVQSLNGRIYHLGQQFNLGLQDQIRFLETLKARGDPGSEIGWWLESTHTPEGYWKAADELDPPAEAAGRPRYSEAWGVQGVDDDLLEAFEDEFYGDGFPRMGQDGIDESGRGDEVMDRPAAGETEVSEVVDESEQQDGLFDRRSELPPIPSEIVPPRPTTTTSLPPLPSDIGGLPSDLPDAPDFPTSSFSKLPSLPPIPSNIKPPGTESPPSPIKPIPTTPTAPNPLPQHHHHRNDIAPIPSDTTPSITGLPMRLLDILKYVVRRMANNAALPEAVRKVLRVVSHLVDRLAGEPALPAPHPTTPKLPPLPTTTSREWPVLPIPIKPPPGKPTGPPIGKRPGKGKRPGRGKKGHKGKKGKGPDADDDFDGEMLFTSGFVEVTRRAVETYIIGSDDDDDNDAAWPTLAEPATAAAENRGPDNDNDAAARPKRPLTKEQRAYMHGEAQLLVVEQVEKEHDKHPGDPLNRVITVPTCMAVFARLAKHAEKWMARNPGTVDGFEAGFVVVDDEDDWDYNEG